MRRFLFDYECSTCTTVFEEFEPEERHLTPHCPTCYSKETRKRLSVPRVTGNKSDFDLLDKRPPDPKIFSGPHARSK